ncbi:nucleotide exchange factor GrpE [Alphaproteobacteria bacterium LSUCC0684]
MADETTKDDVNDAPKDDKSDIKNAADTASVDDIVIPEFPESASGEQGENIDPLAALEAERDDLKDQALRALAEVENMRRRTEREISQARKYGHAGFARDLLASVDNLSRAVAVLPEDRSGLDETMTNLVIGVEMINQEITTVLERHGIVRINPLNEKFDYEKHQAMFEVPTSEVEPGTVVQVAQAGWMLHDRLLSPAMVGVAKAQDGAEEA